jgi:hypothetical protein
MRRLHLFEFEDLPWVPRSIRDGGTDLLDLGFDRLGFYRPLAGRLAKLLDDTGERDLVDLGSGGGGGALSMHALLRSQGRGDLTLTLTDAYPNAAAAARVAALCDPAVTYRAQPVDAFAVPADLPGVRTMYGALHHFRPDGVRRILGSAVEARRPIALFDVAASPIIRRAPLALLPLLAVPNLLALSLAPLVAVPLLRPFRWSRLLFTYVIPAIPALFAWDGTVSALRAYAPDELLAIARALPGGDAYDWDAQTTGPALCLVGTPKR